MNSWFVIAFCFLHRSPLIELLQAFTVFLDIAEVWIQTVKNFVFTSEILRIFNEWCRFRPHIKNRMSNGMCTVNVQSSRPKNGKITIIEIRLGNKNNVYKTVFNYTRRVKKKQRSDV